MPTRPSSRTLAGIAAFSALLCPITAHPTGEHVPAVTASLRIPGSVQAEHEAIHTALVEATKAPGRVGAAARALAEVLHPHFVREEQIALPPLGLLAPLAHHGPVADAAAADAMAMADTLRRELPRMLEEHTRIRAAVAALREAAEAEKAGSQLELAEDLALHAQTEEDVLYPAAVLVGDFIRAGLKKDRPPAR